MQPIVGGLFIRALLANRGPERVRPGVILIASRPGEARPFSSQSRISCLGSVSPGVVSPVRISPAGPFEIGTAFSQRHLSGFPGGVFSDDVTSELEHRPAHASVQPIGVEDDPGFLASYWSYLKKGMR